MVCLRTELPEVQAQLNKYANILGSEDAAYYVLSENNGYDLDKAPNGLPSKLFSDLLSYYNGDENAAILAKSKVFTQGFKNWFGDWLSDNKTNVSKIVDENGEPLVVYHGSSATFDTFNENYLRRGLFDFGFYFTPNTELANRYASDGDRVIYPVFLNLKEEDTAPLTRHDDWVIRDGIIVRRRNENVELSQEIVVRRPDQIKSIDNQGTFSTQDNNIYHSLKDRDIHDVLVSMHLIHSRNELGGKNYYLRKTDRFNYNTGTATPSSNDTMRTRMNRLQEVANSMGYIANLSNPNDLTSRVLLTPIKLQDLISASSDNQAAFEIILFLADRFPGLKVVEVPASAVKDHNVKSWIENDTIYLVKGRYTDQIAVEEAIHPFINTLFHTNRDLFNSLYDEISKSFPALKALIDRAYSLFSEDTRKQELVAQGFSRAFDLEFKNKKPSRLKEVLNRFIDWLRSLFTTELVSTYDLVNYIDTSKLPKMTLRELVELVHTNDTKFDVMFEGRFNNLSAESLQQINKTYDKIQKGLKNRLNAVKRYTTKNPNTWNRLLTVIQQLLNSEAEQGILLFIDHINDTIGDSVRFLNKPFNEINAKQVRQLSQDYVGFYKPLLDEINYLLDTTDIFKELPNYNEIRLLVTTLTNLMNTVNNRFTNIARAKGILEVVSFLLQQGMPKSDIDALIDYLNNPTTDTSLILNWFGMASNSDNAVIRSIAKILNDTKNLLQRDVLEVGNKLISILDEAKKKYGNDVQKLLYEKLDDGTYSGYRVKPLNYGLYKKDCMSFIDSLALKLGITKDKEGQYVLPEDEDIQKKWFDSINNFYSKRAVRRYKAEYYTLRNKILSMKTRDAINEILNSIDTIVNPITIDGVEHTELLSEVDYKQLLLLRRLKLLLANPYNLDGTPKTGVEAQIAKELTQFYSEINKRVKYKSDIDRFNKDLAAIKRLYKDKPDKVDEWIKRNTKKQYTLEFYDLLEKILRAPLSKLYLDLTEKRRHLLRLFTDPETGTILANMLSDSERKALLDLDLSIADEYMLPALKPTGLKFADVALIVPTDEYYRDAELAKLNGVYNSWFKNNHYEDYRGNMHPASYYTTLKPVDEAKYTELVPTGKYTLLDPSSELYDDRFDPNGPATQPSKEFYDNSKAYNAVMSKPEVKALYDAIEEVMNASNSFISFLTFANDSRMPLIPARFMQVMMRNDGVFNKLKYAVSEFIETQPDDYDYVDEFATMPNGDPIKVIPTRFIKMLDNPNSISTDAVASVIAYYSMADNFRLMSLKLDTVELMLGLLRNLTISTRKGVKNPGDSNAYKLAQLLVDRLMYGRNKTPIVYNVLGKELNVSKALDLIRAFVTKVNLSGNIWSIATSFFTDATYTTLESKLGRFFDSKDLRFAVLEFSRQLPSMMSNIGNPNPKGKLPFLIRLNQVVKDNLETYDRLDQSSVLRSINLNFWFMGYTQSDYAVKSHTLLSIYHNYRFVKGYGFMSKQEYINKFYNSDIKRGENEFDLLDVTLYDAYIEHENGDVEVDDKYALYITTKLLDDVKNRIEILSRRIDGTMRDVDKAQVHANSLASYLVMHRNFMISALHDRFKRRLYNLDLHMMEEGYYRSTGRFLNNIIRNRHFSLTLLLADYNLLEQYELYAVKRVANELILVAASTTLAVILASIVDGDDDYDNWLSLSVTYIAMRSAFEFRTMYNPLEFVALIKSPTAAFTALDNASSLINLFNPASYVGDRTPFTIIDRGSYKGMPVILRNIIKVTPFRSIFEAGDPKSKRNYLLNLLMNF